MRHFRPSVESSRTVNDMNLLPTNEHPVERVLRVIIGIGLLAIVFVGPQTPWGWLGVVPLATGLLGSCPLYTLLGIRTCPVNRPD